MLHTVLALNRTYLCYVSMYLKVPTAPEGSKNQAGSKADFRVPNVHIYFHPRCSLVQTAFIYMEANDSGRCDD